VDVIITRSLSPLIADDSYFARDWPWNRLASNYLLVNEVDPNQVQ
jgi:hypothetical protein